MASFQSRDRSSSTSRARIGRTTVSSRISTSGLTRRLCKPLFDVKTDRIHHTVSAEKCVGHRPLVVNVSAERSKFRIIWTKQLVTPVRMP